MSKKRPGVEAAIRLSRISDVSIWERVESQHDDVLALSKNDVDDIHKSYEALGKKLREGQESISKEELMEIIIPWKFSVGKPRHALMKLLHSNSESSVINDSKAALEEAKTIASPSKPSKNENADDEIKEALEQLSKRLKGVGPATASALLSLVRPDIFCYMYDEVIDCFEPKRTYTLPVYVKINNACQDIANTMKGWTTTRVARALWIAARICAAGREHDHTLESENSGVKRRKDHEKKISNKSTETKRKKRK